MNGKRILTLAVFLMLLSTTQWACQRFLVPASPAERFEIWAMDQSDTHPAGGGLLYIWDGPGLSRNAGQAKPEVIDLAQTARTAGCRIAKRPHMVLPNHFKPATHVIIANVGSGDIFFLDVMTRKIVGCVNIVGAGGLGTAKSHTANATPDNVMVIVADMAGNALHKIQTDYQTNRYTLVEAIDLKGFIRDLGTSEAKPICHEFTQDSRFAYVTMAEGGLVVVKVGSSNGASRMKVVKVYPKDIVPGIGCGAFRLPNGDMVTNGESGAKGGDDFLYIFDTSGATSGHFPDPVRIELSGEDTHGVGLCIDESGNPFAVTGMRVSNDINVIDLRIKQLVGTQSMARSFSPDPKPDVTSIVGHKMFIALRGPKPLTAIEALTSPDRTPGVAVLTLSQDCKSVAWDAQDLAFMNDPIRTTMLDDGKKVTASDPHGLAVILR